MNTLLRALATNRDIPGWEDTAMNWLIAAIVIATIVTLLMVFVKLARKKMAVGAELTWSRKKTALFALSGLLPVAALLAAVWYSSMNFQSIAGVPGLLKAILIAWLFYSASMTLAHAGLWRNDLK